MFKNPASDVIVVIPAFNEEAVISSVVSGVIEHGYRVVVVDDGSSDNTFKAASAAGALCFRHRINRGKGAATKTGIEAAKTLEPRVIVTMDGDNQHSAADIPALAAPILEARCEVSLGIRTFHSSVMPSHRVAANHVGNFLTWLIHGLWVADSQSGFRAFSLHAARLINTRSDRYEYESEVIREIRHHGLRYLEVPISVKYAAYDQSKKQRQNFTNGMKTVYKMIWGRIA